MDAERILMSVGCIMNCVVAVGDQQNFTFWVTGIVEAVLQPCSRGTDETIYVEDRMEHMEVLD